MFTIKEARKRIASGMLPDSEEKIKKRKIAIENILLPKSDTAPDTRLCMIKINLAIFTYKAYQALLKNDKLASVGQKLQQELNQFYSINQALDDERLTAENLIVYASTDGIIQINLSDDYKAIVMNLYCDGHFKTIFNIDPNPEIMKPMIVFICQQCSIDRNSLFLNIMSIDETDAMVDVELPDFKDEMNRGTKLFHNQCFECMNFGAYNLAGVKFMNCDFIDVSFGRYDSCDRAYLLTDFTTVTFCNSFFNGVEFEGVVTGSKTFVNCEFNDTTIIPGGLYLGNLEGEQLNDISMGQSCKMAITQRTLVTQNVVMVHGKSEAELPARFDRTYVAYSVDSKWGNPKIDNAGEAIVWEIMANVVSDYHEEVISSNPYIWFAGNNQLSSIQTIIINISLDVEENNLSAHEPHKGIFFLSVVENQGLTQDVKEELKSEVKLIIKYIQNNPHVPIFVCSKGCDESDRLWSKIGFVVGLMSVFEGLNPEFVLHFLKEEDDFDTHIFNIVVEAASDLYYKEHSNLSGFLVNPIPENLFNNISVLSLLNNYDAQFKRIAND